MAGKSSQSSGETLPALKRGQLRRWKPGAWPKWADPFLRGLETSDGEVETAAKKANIDPRTAYYFREESPEFAARWEKIVDACWAAGVDELARSVLDRATNGEQTEVYDKEGNFQGMQTRYNATRELFLLKCLDRGRFNPPSQVQVSEADLSEMVEALALAVAQEASPEVAERIFEAWDRDVFSKLRGGAKSQAPRTVDQEEKGGDAD